MKVVKIFLLILFIQLSFFCGKLYADENKEFILILVPDFSFQEVRWAMDNSTDFGMWTTGGMLGVNIRPDGTLSYLNNTVTLSTGVRGVGVENWNAYQQDELLNGVTAKDYYQQLTGRVAEENIIHPYLKKLVDKNRRTTFQGQVGILGQTLKSVNVDLFVIGNSDTATEKVRYGSLFTMNEGGFSKGELIDATKKVSYEPNGIIMDVDKIHQLLKVRRNMGKDTFTVIEWGDIYRLYQLKNEMNDQHFQEKYKESINRLEKFLFNLLQENKQANVMLLSPMVNKEAYAKKELLAPLYYWNGFESNRSYQLKSLTTRQQYVGSNLDIVPTILNYFQIERPNVLYGSPLVMQETDLSHYERVLNKMDLIVTVYSTRSIILSAYITLLVLLLLTVSGVIFFKKENSQWVFLAQVLIISGISSPLWFLITPNLLNYIYPGLYLVLMLVFSGVTGLLLMNYGRNPIFFINALVFFVLSLDLLFGAPLMQRSYLGYDSIIGARFYGIGNEYAGVYLISGMLLLKHPNFRKYVAFIILASTHLIFFSSGQLGANAGATLATGVMYTYFVFQTFFKQITGKQFALILTLIMPIFLILLYVLQLQDKQTHISYAFGRLLQGDLAFVLDVIKRKLQMNWKIFRFSNWTQLFVTTYILIGLYLWRGKKDVKVQDEQLLIQTGIIASIALLVLNDSGVVAAATSMFLIVCTSYFWRLERTSEKRKASV